MKIGYLIAAGIPLSFPKGDSVHIHSFLENFMKSGGDIFFIRKKIKKGIDEISNIRTYDIRWIGSPSKFQGLNRLLFNIRLYQAGSSILKNERPDILHEREMFLNLAGLLLAKKFKIPYVLEVNAPVIHEVGKDYPNIYKKIGQLIEKKLFTGADKIIVVSEPLKNYLIDYGVAEEKLTVVPNGVNEQFFHPDVSGEKVRKKYDLENKEVICFAGSLHQQWQGIDDILRTAKMISTIRPSVNFVVVGGEESDIKLLEKKAPDNVILTGRIDHAEIPAYLAAADILIAPYKSEIKYFYNSPIKLFEYMAMGKSIITSNIGQIGEIIEHGETGLLNKPGNYKELTENILLLLENEKLRKKLGERARKEVIKKYTWEQNARKITSIYEELLDKRFSS